MNNINMIHFHCIIFDNYKADHKRYNSGSEDIGLSKLYYQLIHHKVVKNWGSDGSLYVRLDHRNSQTPLSEIGSMLNNAAKRDYGLAGNPVKQLVSWDSKKCDLLQLNDVVLGAICAAKNGKHLIASTRQAKREIASLVLAKSGLSNLDTDTPRSMNRFTVWNMRTKEK